MLDGLMDASGVGTAALDAVAFGRGPGSFTGLRIAAGIAQGIAFARDIPVIGISTLEVLAAVALAEMPEAPGAVCAIGARPGEVYLAAFTRGQAGQPEPASDELLVAPGSAHLPASVTSQWVFCGDAADALVQARWGSGYSASLAASSMPVVRSDLLPHASELVRLAAGALTHHIGVATADTAFPVYLQPELPWRKVSAQSGNAVQRQCVGGPPQADDAGE